MTAYQLDQLERYAVSRCGPHAAGFVTVLAPWVLWLVATARGAER